MDIVFFFSCPFKMNDECLDFLDHFDELESLRCSIQGHSISFASRIGNRKNFQHLCFEGPLPTVFYYSGHGAKFSSPTFFLEDKICELDGVTTPATAESPQKGECAILGCCWSICLESFFVKKFNHVVASTTKVETNCMKQFAAEFLKYLLQGQRVIDAFRTACRDNQDIILLPEDQRHEEVIFPRNNNNGPAVFHDHSCKCKLSCHESHPVEVPIPYFPEVSVDAEKVVYRTLTTTNRRLVVLRAVRFSGVTTILSLLSKRIAPREHFSKIYFVPVKKILMPRNLSCNCSAESLLAAISCSIDPSGSVLSCDQLVQLWNGDGDLETNRILLMLDGCDLWSPESQQETGAAKIIMEILQRCANVYVVASCRNEALPTDISVLSPYRNDAFPLFASRLVHENFSEDFSLSPNVHIVVAWMIVNDLADRMEAKGKRALLNVRLLVTPADFGNIARLKPSRQLYAMVAAISNSPIIRSLEGNIEAAKVFSSFLNDDDEPNFVDGQERYEGLAVKALRRVMLRTRPIDVSSI